MPVVDAEARYLAALEDVPVQLERAFNDWNDDGPVPLNSTLLSEAIIDRLRVYYQTQRRLSGFLEKRKVQAASDFFVETILFFVRVLNETHDLGLTIRSEQSIARKQRAIRPDISLWRDSSVMAIIECKTQLGWDRHHWEDDFQKRRDTLLATYPGAEAFLLVMTTANWGGFDQSRAPENGRRIFSLLSKAWPEQIVKGKEREHLLDPVEYLLREIVSLANR